MHPAEMKVEINHTFELIPALATFYINKWNSQHASFLLKNLKSHFIKKYIYKKPNSNFIIN